MTSTAAPDFIARAKEGDRSAFDQLIGPLVDQGFRLAYGMLHDREAADVADAVTQNDINRLLAHERFLTERFGRSALTLPGSG